MNLSFKIPPAQETTKSRIRNHLRSLIITGELLPGRRLSENELAQELGTSRTPVREAIQFLQREGLIEVRPQSGSYVAAIDMQGLQSNYLVRETLECRLVRDAARACTARDAEELTGIIAKQVEYQANGEDRAFFESDEAMHKCLMRIAGHPAVWDIVHAAKAHLDRVRHFAIRDPESVARIIQDHERIVEAVCSNKTDMAVEAMRYHLSNIFQVVDKVKAENREFFVE